MLEYLSGSLIYSAIKDFLAIVRGRRRSLTPAQVIQARQKWKKEFEGRLRERQSKGLSTDAIIRDMKRIDNYPEINERKPGISSWFRTGLMSTYHRGIMIGLRWERLTRDAATNSWTVTDDIDELDNAITSILIGYVPYENIEVVDWDGDEYYRMPIIYCYFDAKGREPYERLAYCERRELNGYPFYTEIASLEAVTRRG